MNNYTVYAHTNLINGKVYIGITGTKPTVRWNNGRGYRGSSHMRAAIDKYGWDNFKHDILFSGLTKEDACLIEQDLIKIYGSTNPEYGYNLSSGGESGALGVVESVEDKVKRSASIRKAWMSEELRKAQSERLTGIIRSEETRKRMSESSKGKVISEEQRKDISETLKTYYSNPENRKRLSDKTDKREVVCEETGVVYDSSHEAYRQTGICQGNIYACCLGKRNRAGGYHWKFVS